MDFVSDCGVNMCHIWFCGLVVRVVLVIICVIVRCSVLGGDDSLIVSIYWCIN